MIGLCKEKLKECISNDDGDGKREYMEKLVQLGLERQSESEVIRLMLFYRVGQSKLGTESTVLFRPCRDTITHAVVLLSNAYNRNSPGRLNNIVPSLRAIFAILFLSTWMCCLFVTSCRDCSNTVFSWLVVLFNEALVTVVIRQN